MSLIDFAYTENNNNSKYNYDIMRHNYNNKEYIPNNTFPLIMSHHFTTSELLFCYNETQLVYKIKIKDLLNSFMNTKTIKNWEHNRPPDLVRCPDIARNIFNSKNPIDTIIYLTWNNIKGIFEVLDGIHRLTALAFIKSENIKQFDLLDNNDFSSDASWLYEQYILCNIRFNATKGQLVEAFENLNKIQIVPELYIKDHNKDKRDIIDAVVNEWMVKYKPCFTSSASPNIPHTNRNKFVELLDKVYDRFHIEDVSSLRKILNDVNVNIENNIPKKATLNARTKCKETGCYLFLYKNDKLEEIMNS